ncbi:unnamed protein product [Victoria cruziana]
MPFAELDCAMVGGIEGESCSPQDERRIIRELRDSAESNSKAGDPYYIISSRWWRSWKDYVDLEEDTNSVNEDSTTGDYGEEAITKDRSRPSTIDNSDLLRDEKDENVGLELRNGLQEGYDYELVPEIVWKRLVGWYGGGPALPRILISPNPSRKELVVEVYPLLLHLIVAQNDARSSLRMSRKGTVRELYNKVSEILKLDLQKIRLWDYFNKTKSALLSELDRTLGDSNMQMDQDILVEVQVDGVWPSDGVKTDHEMVKSNSELALVSIEPPRSIFSIAGGPTLCNGNSTGFSSDFLHRSNLNIVGKDPENGYDRVSTNGSGGYSGLTGLQNLGNTCFMNSALQCLVHTPPLVQFFLGDYSQEINRQNPLGMDGEIALAFGDLLRKLWLPGRTPVPPRTFKSKLARFAPQFSGYNQHDSQELLAFLLDGLHEDLNRVKRKPYIEMKEADGRPDEEVAEEFWANHKARNDSIIVDICQGQYKSTLVCPVCSKVSVTFDPFMYLSLPLPSTATRSMTVTVFYGDGSCLPMPFTMNVQKQGYCKDLVRELSVVCCLSTKESLVLVEVYNHRIFRYLENPYEPLSYIKDDDCIVAYRLPSRHEKFLRLELLHQRNEIHFDLQRSGNWRPFGTPLVTCLPEAPRDVADIQDAVRTVLTPLFRKKSFHCLNGMKMHKDECPIDGDDTIMENCDTVVGHDDQILSDPGSSDEELSFDLLLTDDKGSARTLDDDALKFLNRSTKIQVTMRWSNDNKDLYDTSFLENLPDVFKSGFGMKKIRQEAVNLFSCLDAFLKEEPLGPDDMYCPRCKEHRQATKKLDLWRLPDILVVHLKRFSYSRYFKNKLDTVVNFPICDLDLAKYVKRKDAPESYVYDLYAVSNHYGGMGGGHYTAYVKLHDENKWYSFDDSHVSPVSKDDIKTSAAYVLFYQRRVEPAAGKVENFPS